MRLQARPLGAILSALIVLITAVAPARSCGPFLPESIFAYHAHPDLPLRLFGSGRFGIIEPAYARSYLFVAYRYFSGKPLTKEEQKGVLALWHQRLTYQDDSKIDNAVKSWLATRSTTGVPAGKDIYCYRSVDSNQEHSYVQYLNCQEDAFINAAGTLKQRIATFGASSPQVAEWVKGQDLVFCHCSSPPYDYDKNKYNPEPPFPPALKPGSEKILLADRAYQIAAAHFYAQQFDLAQREFDAIASDPSSPWRQIAPYLCVRALIRKATLSNPVDTTALGKAESSLAQIIKDPQMKAVSENARQLLNFVAFRLHPAQRLQELAASLEEPDKANPIKDSLWDYTQLMDNLVDILPDDTFEARENLHYDELAPVLKENDLTDWIFTFQCPDIKASEHALSKWRHTGSLPWLVAAIAKAKPSDPQCAALLSEVEKIKPQSPAYLSVSFNAIKLLQAQNKGAEATRLLTQVLSQDTPPPPPSALNQLLDLTVEQASTFGGFLQYACRAPAGISTNATGLDLPDNLENIEQARDFQKLQSGFPQGTARIMNNQLPLVLLAEAAHGKYIAGNLLGDLCQSVWVRAMMLNDSKAMSSVSPLLKTCNPALAPYLAACAAANTPAEQKFAAAYMILKFPGLRPYITWGVGRQTPWNKIDDYQDNWWCAGGPGSYNNDIEGSAGSKKAAEPPPRFLSLPQAAAAQAENKRLMALGCAPTYLCQQVLPWAQTHQSDARVPEALHLCVKATRFGCPDKQTSSLSKQAFQILHKNYPNSPWTKKTRFWY